MARPPEGEIDDWGAPKLLGMDNTPFDAVRYSRKPVVSEGWEAFRDKRSPDWVPEDLRTGRL